MKLVHVHFRVQRPQISKCKQNLQNKKLVKILNRFIGVRFLYSVGTPVQGLKCFEGFRFLNNSYRHPLSQIFASYYHFSEQRREFAILIFRELSNSAVLSVLCCPFPDNGLHSILETFWHCSFNPRLLYYVGAFYHNLLKNDSYSLF